MIDDFIKIIQLFRAVRFHLVPAFIAIDTGLIGKGGEFRGFRRIRCVIGITVGPDRTACTVSRMIHIVIRAGIGFHIVTGDCGILLDLRAVCRPEPGGTGTFQCAPVIGIHSTVVRIDGYDIPAFFPAGINRQISAGHGFQQHFAAGICIVLRLFKEYTGSAGLIRKPAQERVSLSAGYGICRYIVIVRQGSVIGYFGFRNGQTATCTIRDRVSKSKCKRFAAHFRF